MNKLAIPAILVATVMVAGMFAFMPVEDAATVHTTGTIVLAEGQGGNVFRINTVLDDDGGSGFFGEVSFERQVGTGVYVIERLLLCDLETSGFLSVEYFTETDLTGGTGMKLEQRSGYLSTFISGTYFNDSGSNGCYDLLALAGTGSETGNLVGSFTLMGSDESDIILHFTADQETSAGDGDGAPLIAYISGISAATDILVTSTIPNGDPNAGE